MLIKLFAIALTLSTVAHSLGNVVEDGMNQFVWSASWKQPTVISADSREGSFSSINIDEFNFADDRSGKPLLPVYKFSIGVPAGEVKLSWQFSDPVSVSLTSPVSPIPVMENALPRYRMDTAAYLKTNIPAGIDTVSVMVGNQRVLHISVRPSRYEFRTSVLNVYKSVKITVNFIGKGNRKSSPGFENVLSAILLNYKTARDFRIAEFLAKRSFSKTASPYAASRTYKLMLRNQVPFSTDAEGMYRVTGAKLKDVASFSSARISDIRLYAPSQIVLKQQYSTGVEDSSPIRQIPTEIVDRNGDGFLDDNDEIRFFGRADTRFRVESATSIKYERNPFDTVAYYWLAVNSQVADSRLRIDTATVSVSSNRKNVNKGYVIIHRERDDYNPSMSGYKDGEHYVNGWLWQNISNSSGYDVISGQLRPADSIADIFCNAASSGALTVSFNNDSCSSIGNGAYRINRLTDVPSNGVAIRYNGSGTINLDYYQLRYFRKLEAEGKMLIYFGLPGTDTLFDYKVRGGSSDSFVCYDVTNEYVPVRKNIVRSGDTLQFSSYGRTAVTGGGGRFVIVPATGGWLEPFAIEVMDTIISSSLQVRNLRNIGLNKDYVIVTHPMFLTQALKLAVHRKDFLADSINNPAVVLTDDIYNHFSGGTLDPAAIRNFLMHAQKNWGTHTALLFGAGYRRYRVSANPPLVPTHIPFDGVETSRLSNLSGSFSTCTDDYFMTANGWKMNVGRFPVATTYEAETVVDKTIGFDLAPEDQKNWRNRVLLTADDDMQLSVPDPIITGSSYHHMSGTEACDTMMLPSIERVKVYMQNYPADPVSREKPLAEFDVIETINRGVLLWYYIGHGASDLVATEKLFTVANSMKKISNRGRNGLFWAASCNVGKFDDPSIGGLCVKLLTEPNKGTVVSVGASRESNAGFSFNDGLLLEFTRALFRTKLSLSVGEAMKAAKIAKGGPNSAHYNLLGDPALRLYPVSGKITVDTSTLPDKMHVLTRYTPAGLVAGMKQGDIHLRLKEPDIVERISYGTYSGGQASMNIIRPGRTIISGASMVNNGTFSVSMLIPKDATVGMRGIKFLGFAASSGHVSTILLDSINIAEYAGSGSMRGDGKGPQIRFYISNNSPLSGTELLASQPVSGTVNVNKNSAVTIEIDDVDGVRLNSVGPNEALFYEIPGFTPRRYIESIKDVSGRPAAGYFSVRLNELFGSTSKDPTGESIQLRVFAMDNFDNSNTGVLTLSFESDSAIGINTEQIYPYPNPFSKETRIVWNTILPADVTINIYTQNGSLIKTLKSTAVTGAYDPSANSIWDGRDAKGNRMARGVYFYTISIKGSAAGGIASSSKEQVIRGAILKN